MTLGVTFTPAPALPGPQEHDCMINAGLPPPPELLTGHNQFSTNGAHFFPCSIYVELFIFFNTGSDSLCVGPSLWFCWNVSTTIRQIALQFVPDTRVSKHMNVFHFMTPGLLFQRRVHLTFLESSYTCEELFNVFLWNLGLIFKVLCAALLSLVTLTTQQ